MDCVIGVDAGGTKTAATAYALDGTELKRSAAGPGNGTLGFDRAEGNIAAAVSGCLEDRAARCLLLCVGMAGLDPAEGRPEMARRLAGRFRCETVVVSDAELALDAAHGGGDGLLVIAGTGSIACGRHGDLLLRRGGWGHLLGDEGSGYAIAVSAIRAVLRAEDDGSAQGPLAGLLFGAAGAGGARALVEWVYRQGREGVASLSPTVAKAAEQGDEAARAVLERAGDDLAGMAVALNARLGLKNPRVALSGGVLTQIAAVRQRVMLRVGERLPCAAVLADPPEPQRAALVYYRIK